MRKKILLNIAIVLLTFSVNAQKFECNEAWVNKIRAVAPKTPEATPEKTHKVLVFDLFTAFNHWVIPHVDQVMKVLGEESGAFEVEVSNDVHKLSMKSLKKYDAVVLNNNCSQGPRRNLILDALEKENLLNEKDRIKLAGKLEADLIKYVKKGGGLMVIHGAIVMQNNSQAFSEMVGGSFDYHPPAQKVTLDLVDPDHPLVKAFHGESFTHLDEPYLFNKAYAQKNFRPLLSMNTTKLVNKKKEIEDEIVYVSWIKKYGKGRVFYVSPSHNAQSYEDPRLLKFYLDGAQYVLGDLKCDDTPMN